MKSFFALALATFASAALDNETDLTAAGAIKAVASNATALGSITVKSGWTKNGSGTDATTDVKLSAVLTKDAAFVNDNLKWLDGALWNFVFTKNDAAATESEVHQFTTSSTSVQTQKYGTVAANVQAWDGKPWAPATDSGEWKYQLKNDVAGVSTTGQAAVKAGYWNVDLATSRINTAMDVWSLDLTRSSAGVADIKVGSTTKTGIAYMSATATAASTATWFKKDIDFIVSADTSADTTDTTTDGATSVTTFGAAVVAAIAALMF